MNAFSLVLGLGCAAFRSVRSVEFTLETFALPLIPNGYVLVLFLRSSLYFYYCSYYHPWTMYVAVHRSDCELTTLLERSFSEISETGKFRPGKYDVSSFIWGPSRWQSVNFTRAASDHRPGSVPMVLTPAGDGRFSVIPRMFRGYSKGNRT